MLQLKRVSPYVAVFILLILGLLAWRVGSVSAQSALLDQIVFDSPICDRAGVMLPGWSGKKAVDRAAWHSGFAPDLSYSLGCSAGTTWGLFDMAPAPVLSEAFTFDIQGSADQPTGLVLVASGFVFKGVDPLVAAPGSDGSFVVHWSIDSLFTGEAVSLVSGDVDLSGKVYEFFLINEFISSDVFAGHSLDPLRVSFSTSGIGSEVWLDDVRVYRPFTYAATGTPTVTATPSPTVTPRVTPEPLCSWSVSSNGDNGSIARDGDRVYLTTTKVANGDYYNDVAFTSSRPLYVRHILTDGSPVSAGVGVYRFWRSNWSLISANSLTPNQQFGDLPLGISFLTITNHRDYGHLHTVWELGCLDPDPTATPSPTDTPTATPGGPTATPTPGAPSATPTFIPDPVCAFTVASDPLDVVTVSALFTVTNTSNRVHYLSDVNFTWDCNGTYPCAVEGIRWPSSAESYLPLSRMSISDGLIVMHINELFSPGESKAGRFYMDMAVAGWDDFLFDACSSASPATPTPTPTYAPPGVTATLTATITPWPSVVPATPPATVTPGATATPGGGWGWPELPGITPPNLPPLDGTGGGTVPSTPVGCSLPWAINIPAFIEIGVSCYRFDPLGWAGLGTWRFVVMYYQITVLKILSVNILPGLAVGAVAILFLFVLKMIRQR